MSDVVDVLEAWETTEAHMNLFKTFTLKWWQGAFFKWGMLTAGIAIGAYWYEFFSRYIVLLIMIAVVALAYVTYVWWKQ